MGTHAEVGVAAPDDDADPKHARPGFADDVEHFFHRTARRYDVFNDHHAIRRFDTEIAAQRCNAVHFLDEHRFGAERSRDFIAEDDAAYGGADDNRGVLVAECVRNFARNRFDHRGIFENAKFLNEAIAVTSGTEAEVSVEQRASILEFLLQVHACPFDAVTATDRISSRIAFAAANGSRAPVIGRPTTR